MESPGPTFGAISQSLVEPSDSLAACRYCVVRFLSRRRHASEALSPVLQCDYEDGERSNHITRRLKTPELVHSPESRNLEPNALLVAPLRRAWIEGRRWPI